MPGPRTPTPAQMASSGPSSSASASASASAGTADSANGAAGGDGHDGHDGRGGQDGRGGPGGHDGHDGGGGGHDEQDGQDGGGGRAMCPLGRLLILTGLASLGTGVFWHGLPFIAKSVHGYDQQDVLVLFTVLGGLYTAGAFTAHRLLAAIAHWASTRTVLLAGLGAQTAACGLPLVSDHPWTMWTSAIIVTGASAIAWPIVEAYLGAGRHGPAMRRAIAAFNFVWMPAMIVPVVIVGPMMDRLGATTIALLGIALLASVFLAATFPREPAEHTPESDGSTIPPNYPHLMASARILLPLGYVLSSAMSPLLPFRFDELAIELEEATPLTSSWMVARVVILVAMWFMAFWHGRWGTLLATGASLIVGFSAVMLAPNLAVLLSGFIIFGAGLGASYYAALYYGLAVGRAGVDAGGTHEGLIGVGYCIGPLAALIGTAWARYRSPAVVPDDADPAIAAAPAALAVIAVIMAAGIVFAIRPWLADRARRAAVEDAPGRASAQR
ncbi:MAG: hypothetical protein AB8G96_03375 [Phycisphaerales bacterium]